MGILCGGCTLKPDPHWSHIYRLVSTLQFIVPMHKEGHAEPTISGVVSGNKTGFHGANLNLHNESITFRLKLFKTFFQSLELLSTE